MSSDPVRDPPVQNDPAWAATKPVATQSTPEIFDGRYRAVRTLGKGGFGHVYLVEDLVAENERLALKVAAREHLSDPEFERRFRNEIRVLRALAIPGVPRVFNDGMTLDGELYYTMTYVEGPTLEHVLKREGTLQHERVTHLLLRILDVLERAHAQGVVHRDMKPANVIVTGSSGGEDVAILDFGIAKILSRTGLLERAHTTNTRTALGTPDYISPEQIRGHELDGRADLYALGVMAYRMAGGKLPFEGTTLLEVVGARLEREPAPLDPARVPEPLRGAIHALLARDRARRPSIGALRATLTGARPSRPVAKRAWFAAVGAVLLLALCAAAWRATGSASTLSDPHGARTMRAPEEGARSDTAAQAMAMLAGAGPRAVIDAPAEGAHVASVEVHVRGRSAELHALVLNGQELAPAADGSFALRLELQRGAAEIVVRDPERPDVASIVRRVTVDLDAPRVELIELPGEPIDGQRYRRRVASTEARVRGRASDTPPGALARLLVDGVEHTLEAGGSFVIDLTLGPDAESAHAIVAEDRAGNRACARLVLVSAATAASAPRAPRGCTTIAGSPTGVGGWSKHVKHVETGLELVLVPPGKVELDGRQIVLTGPFYIARHELTAEQYGPIAKHERGEQRPGTRSVRGPGRAAERPIELPPFRTQPHHPIVDVSAEEARVFCDRAGLRLPTEDEWLWAAAGPAARRYPWGDEFEARRCNGAEGDSADGFEFTAPVGALAGGESWCGAHDLAGNVTEWVLRAPGRQLVLRGGSWKSDREGLRTFAVQRPAERFAHATGFRVALDAAP